MQRLLLPLATVFMLASTPSAGGRQAADDREVYENAVRVLTADIEADSSDAEAWFGLSIAYMHLGRFEDALAATLEAAALDETDPRFPDQLGEVYMALGRAEDAIAAFERAVRLDPRLFFPRLRLGSLYLDAGRAVSAIGHLEESIVFRGRDPSARRLLGLAYYRDGQLERALQEYRRAIFLAPAEEILYLETADVYFAASMEAEAESVLNEAVDLFPESGQAHLGLARLHAGAGRLRAALDEFQLALDSGGELPLETIYKTMGDAHFDLIEDDDALAYYDRALEVNPNSIEALLAEGDLYLRRDALDEAETAYARAVAVDPERVEAHQGLAEVALRRGAYEDAVRIAGRVLELDPAFRRALYIRGQALVRLGEVEEGRRQIERFGQAEAEALAEEQRVRDMQALNREALANLAQGRNAEAITQLREAIAQYPGEKLLYMNLAAAQSQSRLHRDAAETFLEGIERGLGDALTHLRLAREYELLGDAEASQRHRDIYVRERESELATAPR